MKSYDFRTDENEGAKFWVDSCEGIRDSNELTEREIDLGIKIEAEITVDSLYIGSYEEMRQAALRKYQAAI